MTNTEATMLEKGAAVIKDFARSLPDTPGVYRMLDKNSEVLYIGKARSLAKRVVSYSRINQLPRRLKHMVSETTDMEFIHTHTEAEALLTEAELIKKLKPKYNILLRDDKSFPYILITGDHDFPLLKKHRGSQNQEGDYYGPFPGAGAVNRTINTLQKAFMLRNCSDSVFSARTRPCLQYHIKRCTAPCVDYVSKQEYAEQVQHARDFLSGKSKAIQEHYALKMQRASDETRFEEAAKYRDRIKAMTKVQTSGDKGVGTIDNADVISIYQQDNQSCVQVFFFRSGQSYGNQSYFPVHKDEVDAAEILSAFILQFYQNKALPKEIIVNIEPSEKDLLFEALSSLSKPEKKITLHIPSRGDKKRISDFAFQNAQDALAQKVLKSTSEKKILQKLTEIFDLDDIPDRIEVYDNSHISGTNMVGAMIVAGKEGFRKNAYRTFNIKQAAKGDDYGMMREVLERRFKRALSEDYGPGTSEWPDLLLIDGGKGQLGVAKEVFEELGIISDVNVVAISKGPDRNAGRESFHMLDKPSFTLDYDEAVLHYLQRLRDEAHRFAIGSHRAKRKKDISKSPLDGITGIGGKRKKALLHHFGSAKAVASAGIKDLQSVDGISEKMAETIYNHFH